MFAIINFCLLIIAFATNIFTIYKVITTQNQLNRHINKKFKPYKRFLNKRCSASELNKLAKKYEDIKERLDIAYKVKAFNLHDELMKMLETGFNTDENMYDQYDMVELFKKCFADSRSEKINIESD